MRVHLCGVRGSTPAPGADFLRYGGHTSSIALAHDDSPTPTLLLDAGTGIRTVTHLLGESAFQGTILLTHLHWDHVQGLPFFAAADHDEANVSLLLPEQQDGADAASVLARAMSPPHFPMEPTELKGSWSFGTVAPGTWESDGFTVQALEIPHKGGRTFGYRIGDGRSTLTYMPDHCPTELGTGPDGWGAYHPAALELAAQTDMLIHDSQLLTSAELDAEGRFGHAISDYAVGLGARCEAHRVVLFHHRPDRTDEALDALARRYEGTAEVSIAAQGTVIAL